MYSVKGAIGGAFLLHRDAGGRRMHHQLRLRREIEQLHWLLVREECSGGVKIELNQPH